MLLSQLNRELHLPTCKHFFTSLSRHEPALDASPDDVLTLQHSHSMENEHGSQQAQTHVAAAHQA